MCKTSIFSFPRNYLYLEPKVAKRSTLYRFICGGDMEQITGMDRDPSRGPLLPINTLACNTGQCLLHLGAFGKETEKMD